MGFYWGSGIAMALTAPDLPRMRVLGNRYGSCLDGLHGIPIRGNRAKRETLAQKSSALSHDGNRVSARRYFCLKEAVATMGRMPVRTFNLREA